MSKFKGDTGKVRESLEAIGLDPEKWIFNDKRKTFRRIKINHAISNSKLDLFEIELRKRFGNRFKFVENSHCLNYHNTFATKIYLFN
jgi:hypothetical protein